MYKVRDKKKARRVVQRRIRCKIRGTADRPRLCVFRSLKNIYAQAVDDSTGRTMVAASSLDANGGSSPHMYGGNIAAARAVGEKIAADLLAQGLTSVVFDRSGYIYHGRVKALAEAVREKGLKF
ncbi:MAG: 50S ribosomal protein L18 [Acidobacteriota bacterium]